MFNGYSTLLLLEEPWQAFEIWEKYKFSGEDVKKSLEDIQARKAKLKCTCGHKKSDHEPYDDCFWSYNCGCKSFKGK